MPTIIGTNGNDELVGTAGLDDIQGLAGDDLYIFYSGNEHPAAEITDTAGYDTVEFRSNTPNTLTLYAGDTGIERVRIGAGTLYDDGVNIDAHLVGNALDIVGGAGSNLLIGTAFGDTINGGADPDRLTGGLGSDVLTGGTGYDTFADTAAGLNGDTISDFGYYESIIITDTTLAGFTFSLSGNTLTYTGGSLTVGTPIYGQIVARAAAGGGVELTIGPALVPAWPAPPGPPNTGPIVPPESSYSIRSGEYRYMSTQFSHELFSVSPDTLTNAGTIYIEDVPGFYGDMRLSYGHIPHFHNSGTVVVHAHTDIAGNVIALQDNGSDGLGTDVTNSGQIFVVSDHFSATFLLSWSTNTTLENSGLIAVYAPEGNAAAIQLVNDGHITNLAGGEILAEGQSATGILATFDVDLTNAGVIAAWSLNGSPSVGVFAEVGTVTNSGTISGDISVYIDGTLTNSGTLNGAVVADSFLTFNNQATGVLNGNLIGGESADGQFHDIVTNAGLINGNVALFAGNDEFTNTGAGQVTGYVDLGDGNDQFTGGSYSDEVYGGAGNDTLTGNGGDDFLEGGAGDDALNGGAGFDIASFSKATAGVTVSLAIAGPQNTGGAGTDTLTGIEDLIGSVFADTLTGDAAANVLEGGAGNDALVGAAGSDTASYASAASGVTVSLAVASAQNTGGAGTDTLASIENLAGSAFADTLTGDANANTLVGNGGDDLLNGGAGADVMRGGSGNDLYIVDNAADSAEELSNEGIDAVQASASFTLGANVENLLLTGGSSINGTGNALDNILTGNSGANVLDGGNGLDTASYAAAASAITVSLAVFGAQNTGGAGNDTLSNIENLTGSSFNDTLTGNAGANVLEGGAGNDALVGAAGSDTASYASATSGVTVSLAMAGAQNTGGAGTDTLSGIENLAGSGFADTLTGDANANTLSGNAGNDTLVGGAGADLMIGGLGDDRYYIDNSGDVIFEGPGEGDDWAFVLGTYTLAQGVSVETLVALIQSSTDPLVLTGNEFGQSLYGNLGDNYLNGGQGNDYLVGLDGNDGLLGGTGADNMAGGQGNDIYYVDQAGDQVIEGLSEGDSDLVVATASWALTAGAAVETMSAEPGNAAINLTGNEYGQSLYGNDGNNILTGLGGSDYLVGGAGNDKYYVDPSDFIGELPGGGDDWIFVATSYILREGNEIETLVAWNQDSLDPVNLTGNEYGQSLYGSQGANSLNGGAGNDYLVGLGGNDFLLGGAGNDNMAGGQGNDIYYVDSAGDAIFESAGEGDDVVVAFTSFALESGSSVETLSAAEGSAAINLTGNALAQSLYGNAGANILTSGGGADYLVGGAGSDIFVLSNAAITSPGPANISTIADYAAGDVVDVSQILAVGAGTDLIGGGYLRITASGQIQVDQNGGGDGYVTLGNVNGSGNVTVRYLAGGSATDLSVARSASQSAMMGQSAMMAGAVAAVGMAAIVPADSPSNAKGGDHSAVSASATPTTVVAETSDLALTPDSSRTLLAHETRVAIDDAASMSSTSFIGKEASIMDAHPLALHGTALPAALDQGTDLAAAGAPAIHALIAQGIVIPSAEQLLAQGHGGSGSADNVQHNPLISQVLIAALADGTSSGPIDALLDALPANPAAATALDHLAAQPAPAFNMGHEPALGTFADASFHTAFALETLALHHDAPPAA